MTEEEALDLVDGDRVIVRWRGNHVPGTVIGDVADQRDLGCGIELGVVLDAGLGDSGEGEETTFFEDDIVRRALPDEGLVMIGGAYFRLADTLFAEGRP